VHSKMLAIADRCPTVSPDRH